MVVINEDEYLAHYGILRKSGRYPWGSGKDVTSRNRQFLDIVADLERQGMSQAEIAKATGLASSTELRDLKSVAKAREKQAQVDRAWQLKDKGLSNGKIAEIMGLPGESSVRALLAPGVKDRAQILQNMADELRKDVDKRNFVDVGAGVEIYKGISGDRLRASVAILRDEGYVVHNITNPQLGTGKDTNMKVLCQPGTPKGEVLRNRDKIRPPDFVTPDNGKTIERPKEHPLVSIDPKRVEVHYKEQGGDKADGILFVRPGVDDVSLGKSRYAQVRVQVGDSHYIKGMAMYNDDLPRGVDIRFHTSKAKSELGPDKMKALKELERDDKGNVDSDFPFKTVVKPTILDEGTSRERRTAMNKVFEEDDWSSWSKSLSSQFLSKQSPALAKAQLDKTFETRKKEFDEIMSLTNPVVRKKLLEDFSNDTDSASVHLEAARLHSNQRWHVILPIKTMPEHQVFAPNYKNGDTVVLIRFPHAGPFEIPELKVNNNHREAKKFLSGVPDAIGINHKVAERLSGADFDGDTVIVIPNMGRNKVRTERALEGLKGFNPREAYPERPGMTYLTPRNKQAEMGKISNLITDMTIKGANHDQLARAVKHSMVIIDAEKHKLDYKKSYEDQGIAALKAEYQNEPGKRQPGGASTLLSRAGSEVHRDQHRLARKGEGGPIDPVTGRLNWVPTEATYPKTLPSGETIQIRRKEVKDRLAITDDAHELVSEKKTRMETIYADHSNRLKDLANQARLAQLNTPRLKWNESAKKVYANEVESLDSKLLIAKMNAPLERQAQSVAGGAAKAKKEANPNMENDTYKKVKFRELDLARMRTGAGKKRVDITQAEWDAIQAGAISPTKLREILANTDIQVVKKYATPRSNQSMGVAQVARAQMMFAAGHERADIAAALGVSISTLDRAMRGGE